MAMWGTTTEALDATWGTPQPDPFSTANCQFDAVTSSAKRRQEDVFDPFGEEDDGLTNFQTGQLFSEPSDDFVAVETFSPPTFAAVSGSQHYNKSHTTAEVFDTYYHPPAGNAGPRRQRGQAGSTLSYI